MVQVQGGRWLQYYGDAPSARSAELWKWTAHAGIDLLFVVATLLFFSIHLLPGDPVLLILGGDSAQPSPEQITLVRAKLGLDRPLWVQYAVWLGRLCRGDLGRSLVDDRPVVRDLANRLPRTLQLVIPATLVATAAGIALGMFAARRRGRLADPIASSTALLGFSMPTFVVGMLLVALFSITLFVIIDIANLTFIRMTRKCLSSVSARRSPVRTMPA